MSDGMLLCRCYCCMCISIRSCQQFGLLRVVSMTSTNALMVNVCTTIVANTTDCYFV